ncbi:hypothetical protein NXH64_04840 [Butyrivibrio fibrisolvens]|uniref:alginate O-acetyltransferase AlgX-related protein n=1 Tax=Pseudobutyrivibrio ruminis TaxID=46206 RepID=UPI000402BB8E|nr:hypothetical protein [Pseudobutyrivibrio ruminis]MDC7278826.1 hypothetical protein [Butyrivibrio fibrisolvens]
MFKHKNNIKRVFAMFFIFILVIEFIRSNSYLRIQYLLSYLGQEKLTSESITVDSLESEFSSNIYLKNKYLNLNGAMAGILGMQGFYSNIGIYVTDDNYIVSPSNYTTTDYEYDETVALRDFLEENGIQFLYVNEPTKYIDDNLFLNEFGIETYSNRNADKFLSRIHEANINTLDLRDNIKSEGLNIQDLFYRTDHHWTVPAGLWATKIIAQKLNDDYGYNIDLSIYNDENYVTKEWKNCWLGEQGRKVGAPYVGLDNYIEVKPTFPTSYVFIKTDGTVCDGTFDSFIDESIYKPNNDIYDSITWHYSYDRIDCINNNVANGKILIIGDSYEHVTQPFLSLGVHEVHSLIMRKFDDSFSLRNYILKNEYDTVIVAYAQFMIGAHDDETSSQYRMFKFDY